MKSTQTSEARYGAPGVSGAAPLATREPVSSGFLARAGRALLSWVKTATMTLGLMYIVGWLVLTIGVASANRIRWRSGVDVGLAQQTLQLEALRGFALPKHGLVSPSQAGRAFEALQWPARSDEQPPRSSAVTHIVPPWRGPELTADLFRGVRHAGSGRLSSPLILDAAIKPLSTRERAVLRMVGRAPGWREFDLVAGAGSVDILGARYDLPFPSGTAYYSLSPFSPSAIREMTSFGVARAAWHLSEGRLDSAEAALRAVISYGFALGDNGAFSMYQWQARRTVIFGATALLRFYSITNDPRAASLQVAIDAMNGRPEASLADELLLKGWSRQRGVLEKMVADARLPRATRFGALGSRLFNGCGSVTELVAGPGSDTRRLFDDARRDLARFPSERAVIDLMQGSLGTPIDGVMDWSLVNSQQSLTALLGRIYFNPRLESCMLAAKSPGFQW